MPQDIVDKTEENEKNEDELEENEEQVAESPDEADSVVTLSDFLQTPLKYVLGPVILVSFIGVLFISNITTNILVYKFTKERIEKKYMKGSHIVPAGKYRGPLLHIEKKHYMLKFKDTPIYLEMELYLEFESENMMREVWEKTANIEHIVNKIITNKPADYFKTTSGMQRARRLLLEATNRSLEVGRFVDLYFTEFRFVPNPENPGVDALLKK